MSMHTQRKNCVSCIHHTSTNAMLACLHSRRDLTTFTFRCLHAVRELLTPFIKAKGMWSRTLFAKAQGQLKPVFNSSQQGFLHARRHPATSACE